VAHRAYIALALALWRDGDGEVIPLLLCLSLEDASSITPPRSLVPPAPSTSKKIWTITSVLVAHPTHEKRDRL
jgi:hypothetical protein